MLNLSRIAQLTDYASCTFLFSNNGLVVRIKCIQAFGPSLPFGNWRELRWAFEK